MRMAHQKQYLASTLSKTAPILAALARPHKHYVRRIKIKRKVAIEIPSKITLETRAHFWYFLGSFNSPAFR
jgi:hypothetical protein